MGNKPLSSIDSIKFVTYEELQTCNNYHIITTLNNNDCFIKNTLSPEEEIEFVNSCISKNNQKKIIIYGKNYLDKTLFLQYEKLNSLGFDNLHIYLGGMFEWLLLKDIFGNELFPTTIDFKDCLKYKPKPKSN